MHPTHPRRRSWPTVVLLVVTALLVALAAVVLVAPPAGATAQLRPGELVELLGAARRPGTLDHPDPPGGP